MIMQVSYLPSHTVSPAALKERWGACDVCSPARLSMEMQRLATFMSSHKTLPDKYSCCAEQLHGICVCMQMLCVLSITVSGAAPKECRAACDICSPALPFRDSWQAAAFMSNCVTFLDWYRCWSDKTCIERVCACRLRICRAAQSALLPPRSAELPVMSARQHCHPGMWARLQRSCPAAGNP